MVEERLVWVNVYIAAWEGGLINATHGTKYREVSLHYTRLGRGWLGLSSGCFAEGSWYGDLSLMRVGEAGDGVGQLLGFGGFEG